MRSALAESAISDGGRRVMLCTLELPDGRHIRVATDPVEVPTTLGDGPYQYDPFLAGITQFDEEIDLFGLDGVGALTQARVEVVAPADWLAQIQAEWGHVVASTLEIAYLWLGETWEARTVLLAGQVQLVDFGIEGAATSFSVEASPPATSATIGDDSRDMGTDWPPPLQDILLIDMTDLTGKKGIYVYGVVGSIPAYKVGEVGGQNRLVLCNHHLVRTGASYPVTVYQNGTSIGTWVVANTTTSGGKPYAYVEDGAYFAAGDTAYTWRSAYGGLPAADGIQRPALGASDVVRKLLVEAGLAVDWRRSEAALQRLRDWPLGLFIDQEETAISVLRDRVLRHLPIVEMTSAKGLWLAWGDPHLAPIEGHLTFGQEIVGRVDRMTTSDLDAMRNSFVINYSREMSSGDFAGSVTVDASNSTLCYLSQQLLASKPRGDTGVRAHEPLDIDTCHDAATAIRIGSALASRLALPRRILTYELAPDAYWLGAGSVIHLTDAGYALAKVRAVVRSVSRAMTPFRATFEVIDRSWLSRDPL
jgi:hypothetical protein